MKKTFLSVLALAMALSVSARELEVVSIDRVPTQTISEMATISPDGTFAIVGSMGGGALYRVDLASGKSTKITSNGNANALTISPDGQNVVFRAVSNQGKLRYNSLEQVNLATGKQTQLVKPTRNLATGLAATNEGVTAVQGGRAQAKKFGSLKAAVRPVATINYGHLDITTADGKTRTIDPQGRGSYLWPTVSPDGTKVAYCLAGAGAFVANIDGSNARQLGYMHAPQWMGNDMIIGMQDHGSDQVLSDSKIVACDLNGKCQTRTSADYVALYPTVSADGNTILFSDINGNLYTISVK